MGAVYKNMKHHSDFSFLHKAFDISPSHLAILDEDFSFVLVNRTFAEHAGRNREDLVGVSYFDVFPGTVTDAVLREVLTSRKDHVVIDQPGTRSKADDDESYWDRRYIPMSMESGERGILVIFADVTEEVLLKRELEYNYDMLESIFQHTSLAVVRTDPDFSLLFANDAFYDLFGTTASRCMKVEPWEEQWAEELPEKMCLQWRTVHRAVADTGDGDTFRFDVPVADDGERAFQADVNPEFTREGSIRSVITVITDVTETKEREDELETLLVEMNHRIKNNLASVEALARVELYAESKTKEAAIDDIISRISAIGQVHQTLYETASYATVRIHRYLRELLDELVAGGSAGECTYRLNLEVDDIEVSSKVATKLGLMLAELTTNTIKYAGSSGVIEIHVRLRQEDGRIVVTYFDSGDAFPPSVTSLDDLGTGTGILVLQALITDLDGTISFDATVRPPVFVISFPA
jgi:PAS domain S-box-containing protein